MPNVQKVRARTLKTIITFTLAVFALTGSLNAVPWRANLSDPQRKGENHSSKNPSFGRPTGLRNPSQASIIDAVQSSDSSTSTRGRGATVSSRRSIEQATKGKEIIEEYTSKRFEYQQRASDLHRVMRFNQKISSFSFSLDPNPTFKPFTLQSSIKESGSEGEYEFRLFNPYQSGLFYQFGTDPHKR